MKIYNELESLGFFEWLSETHNLKDTDMTPEHLDELPLNDIHKTVCNSMAFRWFREKYGLYAVVASYFGGAVFGIEDKCKNYHNKLRFKTYEEAELECLVKLIDIVKASTNLPEIDETIDGSRF